MSHKKLVARQDVDWLLNNIHSQAAQQNTTGQPHAEANSAFHPFGVDK